MSKTLKIMMNLTLMLGCLSAKGQTYHLFVQQENYEPLVTGFPLTEGVWDDPNYVVPIGFEFEFFDEMISSLESSDLFEGGVLGVNFSANTTSILNVFGADLVDRGNQTGNSMSTIYFTTMGAPGERVFIQEWDNVGFFFGEVENGVYKDYVNFQLKLYEASGDIVFHFGPSSITNPFQDYLGASGPSVGLLKDLDLMSALVADEVLLLSGDPSNPDIVTQFEETYLNGSIPPNTVYRFSKDPSATGDHMAIHWGSYLLPNPTQGDLSINTQLAGDIIFPVRIYNGHGQLVKTAGDKASLHLNGYAPGLYQARFLTEQGPGGQRIALQ